ncbi:hypothetical protein DXG01_003053 [Tephrocybe rancida]|nr:hypothetical protein DXG01_003053 [Tephrocybe rancida]
MARDSPIITGYYRASKAYRCTRVRIRVIPFYDLTEPLTTSPGTFVTGESRLLFSSAQVDYIRYWLHAMGLTKETIPLPYSDCLLTESSLRSVSKVVYPDGGSLRGAIKVRSLPSHSKSAHPITGPKQQIEKNNKRLKGTNPVLMSRRQTFERVRSFWSEKRGVWCALDFEAWELDHSVITEFGWRLVGWRGAEEHREHGHIIVDEHQKYRNSKYVPEHRYDYGFGTSEYVKKGAFPKRVGEFLTALGSYGPVFLVFHDNSQDIKYLKSLGAPLEGLDYNLPDVLPDTGLFVVDTSDLFGALEGTTAADRRALGRMCTLMQLPTANLHNAGNDAYYTLEAMITMADGDPVDIQREKRWPNRTSQGVQVAFKPHEEDSDYSDEEGIVPPSRENVINSW